MIDYEAVTAPLKKIGDEEGDLALSALAGLLENWANSFLDRSNAIRAKSFSSEIDKANKSLPLTMTSTGWTEK